METWIHLEDVETPCVIGIYSHERREDNLILVSLSLELAVDYEDLKDQVGNTIDYESVIKIIRKVALDGKFHLLETYAHALLENLQAIFQFSHYRLEVKKMGSFKGVRYASTIIRSL
jgi:dihydroneopterin aldolase